MGSIIFLVVFTFEIVGSLLAAIQNTFEVIDSRAWPDNKLAPVKIYPRPGPFLFAFCYVIV